MKQKDLSIDRRTFLKTAATASAGIALMGTAVAQTQTSTEAKKGIKLGFDDVIADTRVNGEWYA